MLSWGKIAVLFLFIGIGRGLFSQDTIKIASWNTYLLPKIAKRSNQEDRAKKIASHLLKQDYDIICLQEVFHKKSLKILIDSLSEKFPHFEVANKSGLFKTSSGLVTFCNREVVLPRCYVPTFKKFESNTGIERFAKKGVLVVTYKFSKNKRIIVCNTHMQSTEKEKAKKVRSKQLEQIKKMMDNFCFENFILSGDLNIVKNSTEYDTLINKLNVTDVECVSDVKVTCNAVSNELNNNDNKNEEAVLDYILIDKAESNMKLQNLKYKEVRVNNKVLSDHNLIEAELILK